MLLPNGWHIAHSVAELPAYADWLGPSSPRLPEQASCLALAATSACGFNKRCLLHSRPRNSVLLYHHSSMSVHCSEPRWLAVGGCNRCHTQPPETLTRFLDVCQPSAWPRRRCPSWGKEDVREGISTASTPTLRNVRVLRPPFSPGEIQLRRGPA